MAIGITDAASDVYFDPYSVDINADPYPTFARLREEAPLYYNSQHDFYAVSRYDYIVSVVQLRLASGNLSRTDVTEVNKWLALSAPTVPPCSVTRCRAIDSPSPMPPYGRVRDASPW